MSVTDQFQDIVDPVSHDTLRALAELPAPVVSLYVPTSRHRPDADRSPLELRALADEAHQRLHADGTPAEQVEELLAPVRALQEDPVVWSEQADGLALFASPAGLRRYRLPRAVDAQCVVGPAPHLVPLVPVADGGDRYVVLALSRGRVQLYDATPTAITARPLGSVPGSDDDLHRRGVRQPQLQHQHQARGSAAGTGAVASHHGHSDPGEIADVQLDKFVREVADGLREQLGGADGPPIVLAAVAEYLPRLRDTGLLPTLLDDVVAGNPEQTPPAELLTRSLPIAAARLQTDRDARRERLAGLVGTGRATLDIDDVLAAGEQGRAADVLLDPDACTGSHRSPQIDQALAAALLTGAQLHHVPDLPDGARVAALLRY